MIKNQMTSAKQIINSNIQSIISFVFGNFNLGFDWKLVIGNWKI